MNQAELEEKLAELPLYCYQFFAPGELEFSDRIRWICEHECPMYGKSWACPPGVGTVDACKEACLCLGKLAAVGAFYYEFRHVQFSFIPCLSSCSISICLIANSIAVVSNSFLGLPV